MPVVESPDERQIVVKHRWQAWFTPQPADAGRIFRLARTPFGQDGRQGKVVTSASGVRVKIEKALLLALHRPNELHEQHMLENIRVVARVIVVAIIQSSERESESENEASIVRLTRAFLPLSTFTSIQPALSPRLYAQVPGRWPAGAWTYVRRPEKRSPRCPPALRDARLPRYPHI